MAASASSGNPALPALETAADRIGVRDCSCVINAIPDIAFHAVVSGAPERVIQKQDEGGGERIAPSQNIRKRRNND
jgi:hypothetical protein